MKTQVSFLAATAALFLTVTPFAHAGTPAKKHATKKAAQTAKVDYNAVTVRASQPDDAAAYGAEIGSDAPHQERNPSAHPELFQINR